MYETFQTESKINKQVKNFVNVAGLFRQAFYIVFRKCFQIFYNRVSIDHSPLLTKNIFPWPTMEHIVFVYLLHAVEGFILIFSSYKPIPGDWVQASVSTGSVASHVRPVRSKKLTGTVNSAPFREGGSGLYSIFTDSTYAF